MSFTIFMQLLFDGLSIGLVYVFMAAGFNLILSVSNVFFIAFGMFYVLGAYVTWALTEVGVPFFLAVLLATLVTAVGGAVTYQLVMRRVSIGEQSLLKSLIVAIMLVTILTQLILVLFGTSPRGIAPVFGGHWKIGGVIVSIDRAVTMGISVFVLGGLQLLLMRTNIGRALRALAFNPTVASLYGVRPHRMFAATFAVGLGLAGFAGGLMAPLFGIDLGMGQAGFVVLLIIMLGGIGSMVGSLASGIILGIVISFSQFLLSAGVGQMAFFLIVGVFFFFRPQGLLGKALPDDPPGEIASLTTVGRRLRGGWRWAAIGAGVVVLLALPHLVGSSYLRHLSILIVVFAVVGMTFVFGMRAGMINVAGAAFWGIGAYTHALLMTKAGLSFWAALPLTLLIATALALALGMLVCRYSGMTGMMFGVVFASIVPVVFSTFKYFGRSQGLSGIPGAGSVGPLHFGSQVSYYYLLLLFAAVSVVVMLAFTRAWTGRAWLGLASSPRLAVSVGIDPFGYRLINFVVMSVIPALLGTAYASYLGAIQPGTFGPFAGINFLVGAFLGGLGFLILGPALGAAILVLLPEGLRVADTTEPILTAAIVILMVLFLPRGVLGTLDGWHSRYRPRSDPGLAAEAADAAGSPPVARSAPVALPEQGEGGSS